MQRTAARHEAYKKEQAVDIRIVAELEIKILKENLRDLFLETTHTVAKMIHIAEKLKKQSTRRSSRPTPPIAP